MKPFSFTNKRMTIRIHILYSFLVHVIMLTYLLSLPIYKGSIDLKSYEGYFVYLRSEEGKSVEKPPSVVKKSKVGAQVARDAKTAIKTKEVDKKESIEHFEEKKAAATEVESGLKMEEPAEEEVAQAVEVNEPSEPEKALKEEASAVKEIEVAKKQVNETEDLISKEVTVKEATPPAEKTEEVVKPKAEIKPDMVLDAEEAPSVSIKAKEKKMVLKEEVTASEEISLKVKETPSPAKETMHVEKTEKAVVSQIESELIKKEVGEEEVARATEVNEPSEPEKALKEEASAVKEIEAVKKQVNETEDLLSKEVTVKEATPPVEKTEGAVKPQMEGNVFDTASLLKEKGALEKVPSGIEEAAKKTASPALPETDTEGLKKETMNIEDEGGVVAEILTSEKNRTPSQEDYFLKQDEGKRQTMAEIKPEVKERTMVEKKMPPSGIPVSDVLLLRDITVEVFLKRPSSFYSGSHAKKVPATDTKKLKPLPKATEITNISFEESADIFKVRIKGNGLMTSNVFSLYDNRIVIDIPDVMMNAPLPSVGVSPLKGIRSGEHMDKIRLVLDLKEMMSFDVSSFGDTVVVTLKRLEKEPPLLPDAQRPEWEIEASERKAKMSNVLLQLFKKAHPMVNRKDDSEKKVGVAEEKEETHIAGTLGVKRVSLAKAEKGIYTVTIGNKGEESCEADIVFRLFEGKEGERVKEFKTVELSPNVVLKFKFILPEAIFWDDEHYFTGTIESSNTLTKFSEKTGLIWKEEKDY